MSIKNYMAIKNEIVEAKSMLELIGKEQKHGRGRVKVTGCDIAVISFEETLGGIERYTSFLNRYMKKAAEKHINELINTALELMKEDLSKAAIAAQDDCIKLLQEIGSDKK